MAPFLFTDSLNSDKRIALAFHAIQHDNVIAVGSSHFNINVLN